MKVQRSIVKTILMCLAAVPSACDSPKDASQANFTKALNEHLSKDCQMVSVGLEQTSFPRTVQVGGFSDTAQYDALVEAGLLMSKPDNVAVKDFLGNSRGNAPAKTYDLTAEGRSQLRTQKGMFGGLLGFCAVKYKVAAINNFTPPQNAMGQTVSQVNFTPAADVQPWTRNAAVQATFRDNVVPHTEPRVETLLLTEKGWISARDFGSPPVL